MADDVDYLVDVEKGDEETGQDVQPALDLGEAMCEAPPHGLGAVAEPLDQQHFQVLT